MELVNIKDLSKTFKGKRVLHDINFTIEKGEIYGLVGNNGAGKTTLLRMICNLLQPTSGRIEFNKEAFSSKIKVGTLIEHPALYFDMTAYKNIKAKALALGVNYSKDEIYFICGMDNLEEFHEWRHYEEILSTYQVIVITRNKEVEIPTYLKPYQKNIILAETHERNISSTSIRNTLLEGKVDENLTDEVYEYIKNNKLYEKEHL